MNIKINGQVETLIKTATIADLIEDRGLIPEKIVVEHNYRIVPKEEWSGINLKDSDSLEIVSFVGGG